MNPGRGIVESVIQPLDQIGNTMADLSMLTRIIFEHKTTMIG